MLTLEGVLQKMETLEPEVVFIVNSDRFTNKIIQLSEKHQVDLNAAVLFSVVGDLPPADIADYLAQEKGISPEAAKAAGKDLESQVLRPMEERLLLLNNDPDKSGITLAHEKDLVKKIFSEGLILEMAEPFIIKNALNLRLFNIFESDLNFKRELERAMYENREPLTGKTIMLDGRASEPTIGNWLKDFIARHGTETFDSVALSDYLTNSENARALSQDERQRLFDLLILYRNLKFFPASVEKMPFEEWQIIPYDKAEADNFIAHQKKIAASEDENIKDEEEVPQVSVEQKLSGHDWSKITGIERRVLLSELGVSLPEFNRWLNEKNNA